MDQCYSSVLFGKQRKILPQGVRVGQSQRTEVLLGFLLLYICLLPESLHYANWASLEGEVFVSPEVLTCLQISFFSIFMSFFLSLSFSHCHFGPLFPCSNHLTGEGNGTPLR